jgi:hypothetical protein
MQEITKMTAMTTIKDRINNTKRVSLELREALMELINDSLCTSDVEGDVQTSTALRAMRRELEFGYPRAAIVSKEVHDDPNGELVRCDECNDLVAMISRGEGYERFVACVNRKCPEYMLTIHRSNAIVIQDDGSGNQVLANGTVLR